jgi:hypothetical protein
MESNFVSLLVAAVVGAILVSFYLRTRSSSSVGVLVDAAGQVGEPSTMSIKGNSTVEWVITNQYRADVEVTMQNFRLKLDNGGFGRSVDIFKPPPLPKAVRAGQVESLTANVNAKGWWLWLWWWLLKPIHIKYDIVVKTGGLPLSVRDPEIEMYDKN